MNATAKRVFDIAGSVTGLIVFSPVMALTAVAIRVIDGPPVLYRQQRPGFKGSPFELIKFRTMNQDADESGRLKPDDQRLTALGRRLRNYSLDELPELFNVLRGEMSLVGPRPLLMDYVPLYSRQQARRHDVKPGITGWAQVNGRNALDWESRFRLDNYYIDNQSLLMDLRILLMTLKTVFLRSGVSHQGEATMTPFRGTEE